MVELVMKKKLLLAVLPALLVLSGCKSPYSAAATKVFEEDTIAHEEIFGEAEEIDYFGKKEPLYRNPGEAITAPKIGYQIRYADSKLAIRFVAAINDLNVKAYWKRGVAAPDGTEVASFSDEGQQVTKYYRTITDGPSTITAGVAPYVGYTGFVVYTIYNIPYSTVKDNYVAAYLSLVGDEDGEDNGAGGTYNVKINSSALAVSIERKTETVGETELKNVFAIDPASTGYFLEGTINGVERDGSDNSTHSLLRATASDVSFVNAEYVDVAFQASDSFGSFYYSPTSFKFFGNTAFGASDYFDEASLAEFSSPKVAGTKTLYVFGSSAGAENHIRVKKEVTLYLTDNWRWKLKAHAFNYAANTPKVAWPGEGMSYVGTNDDNDSVFSYTVDIALYDRLIFSNNGSDTDQTSALDISSSANADAYYLQYTDHNQATKWGSFNNAEHLTSSRIVYFTNNKNWGNPKFYVFNSSTNTPKQDWPGAAAHYVYTNESGESVYRLLIEDGFDAFIFNGEGGQTVDILLSSLTGTNNAFYALNTQDGQGHYNVEQWDCTPLA